MNAPACTMSIHMLMWVGATCIAMQQVQALHTCSWVCSWPLLMVLCLLHLLLALQEDNDGSLAPAEPLLPHIQQQQQAPGPFTFMLQQACQAPQLRADLQLPRSSSITAPLEQQQQCCQMVRMYSLPSNATAGQKHTAAAAAGSTGAADAGAGVSRRFGCLSSGTSTIAPVLTACGSIGSSSKLTSPAVGTPRHRGGASSRGSGRQLKRLPASFGHFLGLPSTGQTQDMQPGVEG
jgi:hypothetical protein